jgi:hypothetical protein
LITSFHTLKWRTAVNNFALIRRVC